MADEATEHLTDEVEEAIQPVSTIQKEPGLALTHHLSWFLFLANVVVTYIAAYTDVFGMKTEDAIKKHQTILTPHPNSFHIWIGIFLSELLFIIALLSKWFRFSEGVLQIKPWWILACILQIAWTVAIVLDLPVLIIMPLAVSNAMVLLLLIMRAEVLGKRTFLEYWLLRFPFSLHAGYMMCLSLVWVNTLMQQRQLEKDSSPGVVISTSMMAITSILSVTIVLAIAVPRPDGFFSFGVAWATFWISEELRDPSRLRDVMKREFISEDVIRAFGDALFGVTFLCVCLAINAILLRVFVLCFKRKVVGLPDLMVDEHSMQ